MLLDEIVITYPNYEIKTCQTLAEYTLRSLTVNDELNLKSSAINPNNAAKLLNKVLYNCIIKKPEEIDSYEKWISMTTFQDRQAMIYGLYHATYGDEYTVSNVCSECDKLSSYKIKLSSKGFTIDYYPKGKFEILKESFEVLLPVSNIKFIIKYPTLDKEENVLKINDNVNITDDLEIYLFYVDSVIYNNETIDVKNDLLNFVNFIKTLPSGDKKILNKFIMDNMLKYKVEAIYKANCKSCGATNTINIDFVTQFFRSL